MNINNLEKITKKTVSGNDFNELVDALCSLRRDYRAMYDLYLATAKNHESCTEYLNKERDRYLKIYGKYLDLLKEFGAYKIQMYSATTTVPPTTTEDSQDKLDRDTLIRLERYEEVAELDKKKGGQL